MRPCSEYHELWKVILAEYIEREVHVRLVGRNTVPPINGFTYEGTWYSPAVPVARTPRALAWRHVQQLTVEF